MLCALGLTSAHVPLSQPDFPLTVAPCGARLQSHRALPQVLDSTRLPASHSVPASPAAREAPAWAAPWCRLRPRSMLRGTGLHHPRGEEGFPWSPGAGCTPTAVQCRTQWTHVPGCQLCPLAGLSTPPWRREARPEPLWVQLLCVCAQSCPTLCDPMDYGPPLWPSVLGISRARILEWVAVSFSRGSSRPGIEPVSSALAGRFFYHFAIWEVLGPIVRSCPWGRVHSRQTSRIPAMAWHSHLTEQPGGVTSHSHEKNTRQTPSILPNTWAALLKSVMVIRIMDSWRSCHCQGELTETSQLNLMWDGILEQKNYLVKIKEIWKKKKSMDFS